MSKRKPKSRSYSPRKVGTRELRKSFLIVCEGTKTEPNYFKSFRLPKDVIDIKGLGLDPSKLVENAKKFNQKERYDQVWCVFDRDSWTKNDFKNAIQNAEAEGFGVAYSNEAFELWYILHFEFLNTAIPRNQYLNKLDSLLGNSLPGKNIRKIVKQFMNRYLRSKILR